MLKKNHKSLNGHLKPFLWLNWDILAWMIMVNGLRNEIL